MKKSILSLFAVLFSCISATYAQTASGSDYLMARAIPSKTIFYEYTGAGTLMPKIKWGLDLAWCSETNLLQGRNYLNLFGENVSLVRMSFQPAWELDGTSLSTNHLNGATDIVGLTERLRILGLLGTNPEIFLNCDPTSLGIASAYQGTTSTYRNRWVNLIKATGQYIENQGYTVTGIAPFNEPDLSSSNYPNASTMNNIMSSLKSDSWGSSKKMLAGNVLNPDYALTWYNTCKSNTDEGNTHQLSGTFANYVGFMQQVNSDGKYLCQDEMHNVMEAMIGANYGMDDGIWWGTAEHTRAQFCRANDGTGYRLGYLEDSGTFTAASIYRNTQDGTTEAFLGCSERQATETSYGFVSTDRDVYYNGYGPTRAYYQHLPADPSGSYQTTSQKNAECVIDIQSGEDVQPFPLDGSFQIYNASTGKVIQGNTSWTGWSANAAKMATGSGADGQTWAISAVADTIGGDFSYYTIGSNNGQWWTYYLDDAEWGFEEANPIIMYPGGGSGCEQWYFNYAGDGEFYIFNRYSNLCLDVGDTCVVQKTCTKSASQRWRLIAPGITPNTTVPSSPQGLAVTALPAAVQLSWTANSETDLLGYTILRTVKGANDWNTIARSVSGTTYIDNTAEQGVTYTYKIKAVNSTCYSSAFSSTVDGAPTAAQGLVARWEFDGSARDKSSNAMNGALYTANFTDDNKSGSKALSLDGSSNYVQLPYQIANMPAMTFCGWVYWNGGDAWQRIFDFGNGEDEYMFLTPSNGSAMRYEAKHNGTTEGITLSSKLTSGSWVHVALTIESGNTSIYLDGSLAGSSTSLSILPTDLNSVCNYLGRSQFVSDALLNANLDDVRIYNYALSQSEIAAIIGSSVETDTPAEWAAGGSYYFYNVDAGQFLCAGNSWGTQASLSTTGLAWTINSGSGSGLYSLSRTSSSGTYLFMGSADAMWVDGASSKDITLRMVQDATTGLTTIGMNSAASTTFVGWNGEFANTIVLPQLGENDHCTPGVKWLLMESSTYSNYRSVIAASLSARKDLWPYVKAAKACGMEAEEIDLYENPAATSAALTAAVSTLEAKLLAASASESAPIDYSFLLSTPDCSSETFDGWTTSGSWSSNTSFYRNEDAVLSNRFTEVWTSGTLGNFSMSQTLSNLPKGKYQLAVDIIATQQSNASQTVTGVTLFGGSESIACATANGVPQCFTTPIFKVDGSGSASVGLTIAGTTANWVAFDNFRLLYLGKTLVGDVNKDEKVSIADVVALIGYLLSGDSTGLDADAADANEDSSLTINDVNALTNLILQ